LGRSSKTGHLPLFDRTATLRLLDPQPDPAKEEAIESLCFETDDGPESGFRALVSMLNSKSPNPIYVYERRSIFRLGTPPTIARCI
jgi:hypothetical protein